MSAMTCRFKSGLGYHRGISSDGRAPALQAGGQQFDPAILHHGGLAQLGEHLPYKQRVGGSIPSTSTISFSKYYSNRVMSFM